MTHRKQFTWRIRWQVYQKNDGRCHICGQPIDFVECAIDHVLPRSAGGSDEIANLMPAHKSCNSKKGGVRVKHEYKKDAIPELPSGANFRLMRFIKLHKMTGHKRQDDWA